MDETEAARLQAELAAALERAELAEAENAKLRDLYAPADARKAADHTATGHKANGHAAGAHATDSHLSEELRLRTSSQWIPVRGPDGVMAMSRAVPPCTTHVGVPAPPPPEDGRRRVPHDPQARCV